MSSSRLQPPDPAAEPVEDIAVDVTLIDAMLALTPEQRLRQNDRMIQMIEELRDGFAASPSDDAARRAGRSGR